ncbi:MAG: homogentisate phytyltransferase [Cyanobacteria bacterium SBLK]|nr:homogentisate phytyltransferase [Cyanobacteria bacterium SBLK]
MNQKSTTYSPPRPTLLPPPKRGRARGEKLIISLWKFSRPHTIIGTSLSVLAIYVIAVAIVQDTWSFTSLFDLAIAWFACLCGNVYIVGLNQLEDIAIDRINKPHLPLASGDFSQNQGQWIVSIAGVFALILATMGGDWLLATIAISLFIGTAYSFPPIRLKRFPLLAALCIFTVRGIIVNLGLFLHFNNTLGRSESIPASMVVLTLFILVFTIAIAIFKDVPDMEGDRQYEIVTFTLIIGKTAIFQLSCGIVSICYLAMIGTAIAGLAGVNPWLLGFGHCILLGLLWWRSQGVNLEDRNEIASFYQFIWKLFFLEYFLFPTACWLG